MPVLVLALVLAISVLETDVIEAGIYVDGPARMHTNTGSGGLGGRKAGTGLLT